ncbi:hypothetical protein ACHAXS_007649, partial [Conticribra weissflogii]
CWRICPELSSTSSTLSLHPVSFSSAMNCNSRLRSSLTTPHRHKSTSLANVQTSCVANDPKADSLRSRQCAP